MLEQTQMAILLDDHGQTGTAGLDEDQAWQDCLAVMEYDHEMDRTAREQEELEEEDWHREYHYYVGGSGNYEGCGRQELEEEPD